MPAYVMSGPKGIAFATFECRKEASEADASKEESKERVAGRAAKTVRQKTRSQEIRR